MNPLPSAAHRCAWPPLSGGERRLTYALAVAVTAIIGLFIALAFFNAPAADDFCFAAKANQLGFWDAQAFWYEHWAGRYTLNATWTALMRAGDPFQVYPYPPMLLLAGTWLSFSFLTAKIAQGQLSLFYSALTGGVITVLFIAGLPDPAQTFYWVGGSFTYQLPNMLLVVLLGLLLWRETTATGRRLRITLLAVSSGLVIAIVGSNEVSLLLTGMILSGGAGYALWTRRDSRVFWTVLLVVALAAGLVSLLAPGNIQRYAGLAQDPMPRPTAWLAAVLYLPWVALRLLYWLSSLGWWASALILLGVTAPVAGTWLYHDGKFNRRFLLWPALWIGAIVVLNATGFLINRYPLPERAESVVYLLFLLGGYPSFIILGHYLVGDRLQHLNNRRWLALAAMLLLVHLLGTPNVFEAYKDVYRGYRYDQEMRVRRAALQAARERGETDIVVASLSRPPRTLFATDLETDPNNFRNQCLREYYQVRSIRLGNPTTP